jgi:subtilisin family serine protease
LTAIEVTYQGILEPSVQQFDVVLRRQLNATVRTSGTSYATPLVAGVCALMLEANSNLTPALAKEILRATSERRGNASAPELDPFWNREYGWGIVDAYRACELAARTDAGKVDAGLQASFTGVWKTAPGGPRDCPGAGYGEVETAVKAMKEGAYDYITKPFKVEEIKLIIKNALEKKNLQKGNNRR